MKNYLLLSLLFVGLCSCNKESEHATSNIPRQEKNNLLIKHEGTSISGTEASQVASLFFENKFNNETKSANAPKTIKSINTITDESDKPLMYVINFEPTGFIVVSATKNYTPIIAYSDESQFSHNSNTGVENWINETKNAIKSCDSLPSEEIFKNRIMWIKYEQLAISPETITRSGSASQAFHTRVTQLRNLNPGYNFYPLSNVGASMFPLSNTYEDLCNLADGYNSPREYTIIGIKNIDTFKEVGPLLTTTWNQYDGFNDYLPSIYDYPIGCVTVALGQIMNYNKYPNIYDWGNIPNNSATVETCKLLMDIGSALNIVYGPDASGATDNQAKKAFEAFGYNATLADHNHVNVKNEIMRYRRPVYMSGADNITVAHAWVCDGASSSNISINHLVEFLYGDTGYYNYSDYGHYSSESSFERLFFHMNWGWQDTKSNGWYVFTITKPTHAESNYNKRRKDILASPR